MSILGRLIHASSFVVATSSGYAEEASFSIVDAEDAAAYPISALSYLILPRDTKERAKAEAMFRFVWWALHEGQRYAAALDYAPLPPEIVTRAESAARSLRADGKPIAMERP